MPSVLWRCGYLSGARCRLAYVPAEPLPLTVSCFSEIQIGFTFLVLAHPGSPRKRAIKRCVCVCVMVWCLSVRLSICMSVPCLILSNFFQFLVIVRCRFKQVLSPCRREQTPESCSDSRQVDHDDHRRSGGKSLAVSYVEPIDHACWMASAHTRPVISFVAKTTATAHFLSHRGQEAELARVPDYIPIL